MHITWLVLFVSYTTPYEAGTFLKLFLQDVVPDVALLCTTLPLLFLVLCMAQPLSGNFVTS